MVHRRGGVGPHAPGSQATRVALGAGVGAALGVALGGGAGIGIGVACGAGVGLALAARRGRRGPRS